MDDMETALLVNLAGKAVFMPQRGEIFPGIAYRAVPLLGEVMAVDMYPFEVFIILVVSFTFGADY
jgi:hypothetical protein